MKSLRITIIWLLLLALVPVLSGCGERRESPSGSMRRLQALETELGKARSTYSLRPTVDSLYGEMMRLDEDDASLRAGKLLWRVRMNYSAVPSDTLLQWLDMAETLGAGADAAISPLLHLTRGMVEYRRSNMPEAYKSLRQAQRLYEAAGDSLNAAYAKSYLGMIFERLGGRETARGYLRQAFETFEARGADFASTQLSINLANVTVDSDRTQAIRILDHTIRKAGAVQDTGLEINARISRWIISGLADRAAVAEGESILRLARLTGDDNDICLASINLADALVNNGRPHEAIAFARFALRSASDNGFDWLRFNSLPPMIRAYDMLGQTDSAYVYQCLYLSVADSIGISPGAAPTSVYTQEMRDAISDYDKRLEAEERGRILRNRIILIIALSLVLIACMAFVAMRSIKKRHLSEKQVVRLREQELEHRNEILKLQLQNQGRELSARAVSMDTTNSILQDILQNKGTYTVDEIIRLLRLHINEEETREHYQNVFEKTNPEFFHRLKAKAPTLSENELRHCCLIAMGLNIKQISTIMGIAQQSVQKARYRLRRKLQAPGDSLEQLIRNLYAPSEPAV